VTYLWLPRGQAPLRIRRNPQASLYQPVLNPDDWGYDNMITPNGVATLGATPESIETLYRAGTRGGTALGALAGLALTAFSWKGMAVGGLLGYFGGRFVANLADKALAAAGTTITKIEKATS
jgi:hypothetical protein